jgi:hypothetical protein
MIHIMLDATLTRCGAVVETPSARNADPNRATCAACVERWKAANLVGEKLYREQERVGTARYVVSFHDGVKQHTDGSAFYDIRIFGNWRAKDRFVRGLQRVGYRAS